MNQADKEEAFALISRILHLTRPTPELDALRELITRQKPDEDGEMWRYLMAHAQLGIRKNQVAILVFPTLIPAPDNMRDFPVAVRAAMKGTK